MGRLSTKHIVDGYEPYINSYILSGDKTRGAVLICQVADIP